MKKLLYALSFAALYFAAVGAAQEETTSTTKMRPPQKIVKIPAPTTAVESSTNDADETVLDKLASFFADFTPEKIQGMVDQYSNEGPLAKTFLAVYQSSTIDSAKEVFTKMYNEYEATQSQPPALGDEDITSPDGFILTSLVPMRWYVYNKLISPKQQQDIEKSLTSIINNASAA